MKKYKIGDRIIHANSVVDAVKIMKQTMRDDASKYATIMALIEDEKAAVEAYNVAIRNLEGQIPDESLAAIKAIRDDENRHIENLMAVVNGTVTEKNLEDSVRDSYVELPLVLNQYEINALRKFWFNIEKTGREKDGYPVYRLTGDREKILHWLRRNYDRNFSSSDIHDSYVIKKNLEDSLRYTRKAQIYVYPRSSNDKQDILRLCSNLNTKCKILSETNEQMKLEIDGDVYSVVDDLKSLGLMRRSDRPQYVDV